MQCFYSIDLGSDGSDGTNNATVVVANFGNSDCPVENAETLVPYSFANVAPVLVDQCVTVTESCNDHVTVVCANQSPFFQKETVCEKSEGT